MDHSRGLIFASLTALLWGFLAIALKMAVMEVPPVTVVWFRFTSAFITLAVITALVKPSDFRIFYRFPLILVLAAIFLGGNYLGFIAGMKYVSPSTAQVFIQAGPVSFALAGIFIFREKMTWKHLAGFLLVIGGMGLFYSQQLLALVDQGNQLTTGILLVLAGGLSWGVFASIQKKLVKRYPTNQLNLFIYAFCSVMLIAFVDFSRFVTLSAPEWGLMYFLGLNTVLAYGSLALAIKYTEASRVSVIITLNPVITFVLMGLATRTGVSWIEPERFSLISIVGAITVLSGAVIVILAGRKRSVKAG